MATKFNGYTQGPGLLGQDVLHLAARPHQRLALAKYFTYSGSGTPGQFDAVGQQRQLAAPGGSAPYYNINYNAILNFILNVGPSPFPSQLQSGRIVYYTLDSHHDQHLDLAAHRSEPAVLEGLHRLRAGLDADQSPAATRSSTTASNGLTGYGDDFSLGNGEDHRPELAIADRRSPTCTTATIRCGRN